MKALIITAGISLLTVSAMGVALAMTDARADKFEARDKAHQACLASVGPKARADADPAKLCPPVIAQHWTASVRSRDCDAALSAKPEGLYGIAAKCSTPVKTLQAARDAARADLADVQAVLKAERAGRAAAIARATANATAKAERKARREIVDQTAPRDPDGRQHCDARCLRDRTR